MAFTRQWDDRQKARELRAAISTEMITAGTRGVIAALDTPSGPAARAALERWKVNSAVLKARLRLYFPPDLAARWEAFTDLVDELSGLPAYLTDLRNDYAGATLAYAERAFANVNVPRDSGANPTGELLLLNNLALVGHAFAALGQDPLGRFNGVPATEYEAWTLGAAHMVTDPDATTVLEIQALRALDRVTAPVITADIRGFSTTRRDLLRDLLP